MINKTVFNDNNKRNMNIKRFLVKTSMFILCLIGFLVHSYFKIRLFYNQIPITEYLDENFNDDELIKLPSISVCFSGNLFKRPIDNLNNHRRSSLYYNSRQRLPPNVALLDDLDNTRFDDDFSIRKRKNIKSNNANLKYFPRSASQMITVDQAFGLVSKPRFTIKCELIKPTKQRKLTRISDQPLDCEQISPVIESINYEADQKCYTFFSQLQQTQDVEEDDYYVYRSDLNGGDLIQLKIYFEEELLDFKGNQAKVHLLIHNNVEMPNFQLMKTYSLRSSHNYMIYFNQLAYKRLSTNQSPCRIYKNEINKDYFPLSNLQQVQNVLIDYKVMIKNHIYKLFFSSNEQQNTTTKIESNLDDELDQQQKELRNELKSRSESDCLDKCYLETNRKYCICLPAGLNVRRELLTSKDLFCDELRCIQDDLPSTVTINPINNNKVSNNLKNDPQAISNSEQLERLYSLSNGKFVSKREERLKKCLIKNNCISSCEEEKYDYDLNEYADLNLIIQNLLNNIPTSSNKTKYLKNLKGINSRKLARNYYPSGFYFDPNYLQKQLTTTPATNKIENRRSSFKLNQSSSSDNNNYLNDQESKFYSKNNLPFTTKILSTSIIVQDIDKNQTYTTNSIIRKRTNLDSNNRQITSSSSDNQFKITTAATKFTDNSSYSTVNNEENSITPSDNIDDILPDQKEDEIDKEFTRPSFNKFTSHGRKFKTFSTISTSTSASTNKNENTNHYHKNTGSSDSIDEEIADDLPIDETIEERHNSIKTYQSLISFRNNRNSNRIIKQRLSYTVYDLIFDLSLVGVIWLGFSIYLVADYIIYVAVLLFWYIVRLVFCLDWWFKHTKKRHRVVDSASSTIQLTNERSNTNRSSSVSSEESEVGRTFVKSIP